MILPSFRSFLGRLFAQARDPLGRKHRLHLKLVRNLHTRKIPSAAQLRALPQVLTERERTILTVAWIVLVVGVAGWLAGFLGRHVHLASARGGTYVEGVVGSPALLNPLYAALNEADRDATRLVFSGLARADEQLEIVPDLAEEISVSDDGKTYTVRLRERLRFHDGEPLTADDVLFTLEAIKNPKHGSPLRASFGGVEVKKENDRTITLSLKEPFAPFRRALTVGILPAHLWQGVTNYQTTPLNQKPVGAGPFKFEGLTKDRQGNILAYALARNESFHRAAPFLRRFEIRFFPSRENLLEAFRARRIDGVRLTSADETSRLKTGGVRIATLEVPQYAALFPNSSRAPIFKDPAIRGALSFALDRAALIRDVLKGEGSALSTVVLPGVTPPADLPAPLFDLARARAILTEKGFVEIDWDAYHTQRVKDLMREWEAGRTKEWDADKTPAETRNAERGEARANFETEVERARAEGQTVFRKKGDELLRLAVTVVDDRTLLALADAIAKMWRAAGIAVDLIVVDRSALERTVVSVRAYEVFLTSIILSADPDPYPFWHSSQTRDPGLNLALYGNRKADALIEEARKTSDPAARMQKYQEFQKIIAEEMPAIFLFRPAYLYAQRERVKGFALTGINEPADRFIGVEGWYVRRKLGWR